MDLVIKNLPDVIQRKIQALHILSEGQTNMNVLFADAIVTMLDASIAQYLSSGSLVAPTQEIRHPAELQPPKRAHTGALVSPSQEFRPEPVALQDDYEEEEAPAPKRAAAAVAKPPVASLSDQMSFAEGLGDETDEYESADTGIPEAEPTQEGPEPPVDEDDVLVAGTSVNGPSDPEFDELTGVPEDLDDDDDSLYADASASYGARVQPARTPAGHNTPKAEDLGLPDLGSDAASMGFFDAQVSGGDLPAYARADRGLNRRSAAEDGGPRRPVSLPAGEDTAPTAMRRRPRVKVTGAK